MQHQDVGAFEDDDVEYEEVGEGYDEGVSEEEVDEELVEGVVEYDSDEEEQIEGDEGEAVPSGLHAARYPSARC